MTTFLEQFSLKITTFISLHCNYIQETNVFVSFNAKYLLSLHFYALNLLNTSIKTPRHDMDTCPIKQTRDCQSIHIQGLI